MQADQNDFEKGKHRMETLEEPSSFLDLTPDTNDVPTTQSETLAAIHGPSESRIAGRPFFSDEMEDHGMFIELPKQGARQAARWARYQEYPRDRVIWIANVPLDIRRKNEHLQSDYLGPRTVTSNMVCIYFSCRPGSNSTAGQSSRNPETIQETATKSLVYSILDQILRYLPPDAGPKLEDSLFEGSLGNMRDIGKSLAAVKHALELIKRAISFLEEDHIGFFIEDIQYAESAETTSLLIKLINILRGQQHSPGTSLCFMTSGDKSDVLAHVIEPHEKVYAS